MLSTLSKAKQAFIRDAERAGFTVKHETGCIKVYRLSKHKKPRLLSGICVWADGTGHRLDVPLDHALTIRSAAIMRKILGLELETK